MKKHEFSHKEKSDEFFEAQEIAKEIYDYMCLPEISKKLAETHQVYAPSRAIQNIILSKCEQLGFTSEKRGLFSDCATPQLRPDYYITLGATGLILEVERGKTSTNNMDILDIWKCHICQKADYLLLVVPVLRPTTKGGNTRIFEHVIKRIDSFFQPQNYINVKGCFIIGYE